MTETDLELQVPESPSIPHSREAEESVIGAIIINPPIFFDVASFLKLEDFYIHRHRYIWDAFHRLYEKRIPLDLLTLCEELQKAGLLEEVGGSAYLTSLIN